MDGDLVVRAQQVDRQAFEGMALQSPTRLRALAIGILRGQGAQLYQRLGQDPVERRAI